MGKSLNGTIKLLILIFFVLSLFIILGGEVKAATTEKLIICGPSTVEGLAKKRNIEKDIFQGGISNKVVS